MSGHDHTLPLAPFASGMSEGFAAFNAAVFDGPGEIPRKYRELIALGVAMTTQCEVCLKGHAGEAIANGATEEEIAETAFIAAALRAGGGVVHGAKALLAAQRAASGN